MPAAGGGRERKFLTLIQEGHMADSLKGSKHLGANALRKVRKALKKARVREMRRTPADKKPGPCIKGWVI